jgi:hypothetical protein
MSLVPRFPAAAVNQLPLLAAFVKFGYGIKLISDYLAKIHIYSSFVDLFWSIGHFPNGNPSFDHGDQTEFN